MPYSDIEKRREDHKRYYLKNIEKYRIKNKIRKLMLHEFVNALKDKPCSDCHVKYPPYVMDFDHLEKTIKVNSIARFIREGRSKESIKLEMEKCELVCANCHRMRTYKRLKS